MLVLAVGTVPTEAAIVPGAVLYLGLAVQMEKLALFVAALAVFRVEEAFGHFAHVVLVQELALVALLAQTSQPVLADDRLVAAHVPKRTHVFVALAFEKEFADGRR